MCVYMYMCIDTCMYYIYYVCIYVYNTCMPVLNEMNDSSDIGDGREK